MEAKYHNNITSTYKIANQLFPNDDFIISNLCKKLERTKSLNFENFKENREKSINNNYRRFLIIHEEFYSSPKKILINKPIKIKKLIPNKRDILREKFVNRAISYLGVPYSKKYLKKDNPLYYNRIFLDCCGLIRQCVNDLEDEFGFKLGKGNQAYQYDVLPEEIPFEKMKRGDLIFYTGTYYKEKNMKQQPHNLVHVEIFLGGKSGEETIAAREKNGVVSINESYKFESRNYYDIKYHFKSIDNWLKGIHL